jgi:hypothetical protein
VFGGFRVLPYRRDAQDGNDDNSFLFRLMAADVFSPLVCKAIPRKDRHVNHPCARRLCVHCMQVFDYDEYGLVFGGGFDLCFWHTNAYALGEENNGYNYVGDLMLSCFVRPAEGPQSLNNGERSGFVFSAFQVLLVKPVDGLRSS